MDNKRVTRPILLIKILFILLNFIIPAIIILWGCSTYGPFTGIPALKGVAFIILFFLVLPVSITYLIVSMNRVFPENKRGALLYFFPHIVNLAFYISQLGLSEGFLAVWMVQSLPLFLGYILAMIIGFIVLIVKGFGNIIRHTVSEIISGLLLIIFLTGTFIASWIYIFLTGTNYLMGWDYGITQNRAFLFFSISISMVFVFHFKLLKTLYREGKL